MENQNDSGIKILHKWTVDQTKEVERPVTETINGQVLQVVRPVKETVTTKMAIRALKRQEQRAVGVFRASRISYYSRPPHSLLSTTELRNRVVNTSGGVLTEKEHALAATLRTKHVELDMALAAGATNLSAEDKKKIQDELTTVRSDLINLNAINEAVYANTAEAFAENDANNWLLFALIMVERDGKWVQYFEGADFDSRESFMFALEEGKDPFYLLALDRITTYAYWYGRGVDSPEAFKLLDEELAKLSAAKTKKEEPAAKLVATTPEVTPGVTPEVFDGNSEAAAVVPSNYP